MEEQQFTLIKKHFEELVKKYLDSLIAKYPILKCLRTKVIMKQNDMSKMVCVLTYYTMRVEIKFCEFVYFMVNKMHEKFNFVDKIYVDEFCQYHETVVKQIDSDGVTVYRFGQSEKDEYDEEMLVKTIKRAIVTPYYPDIDSVVKYLFSLYVYVTNKKMTEKFRITTNEENEEMTIEYQFNEIKVNYYEFMKMMIDEMHVRVTMTNEQIEKIKAKSEKTPCECIMNEDEESYKVKRYEIPAGNYLPKFNKEMENLLTHNSKTVKLLKEIKEMTLIEFSEFMANID
jgi:hypothetical protein